MLAVMSGNMILCVVFAIYAYLQLFMRECTCLCLFAAIYAWIHVFMRIYGDLCSTNLRYAGCAGFMLE